MTSLHSRRSSCTRQHPQANLPRKQSAHSRAAALPLDGDFSKSEMCHVRVSRAACVDAKQCQGCILLCAGKLLAVALLDCTIKVFFADSLKFWLSLYGHKLPVLSMDISSDSTLLASGSADKNLKARRRLSVLRPTRYVRQSQSCAHTADVRAASNMSPQWSCFLDVGQLANVFGRKARRQPDLRATQGVNLLPSGHH